MAHGVGNVDKVLPEFAGNVFVGVVFFCKLHRDCQQIQRVHCHPTGAVGLLDVSAGRKRSAAVEHSDIVQSEKAALEDVHAFGVFAVHPPGEVQQQFVEDAFQELAIPLAVPFFVNLVNAPCGPGVHRRIHIAEVPIRKPAAVRWDACTTRAAKE